MRERKKKKKLRPIPTEVKVRKKTILVKITLFLLGIAVYPILWFVCLLVIIKSFFNEKIINKKSKQNESKTICDSSNKYCK